MDQDQDKGIRRIPVDRLRGLRRFSDTDLLAVEEPLEIKVVAGAGPQRQHQSVAVTMRTPGQDFDLARGFLFTEGLIGHADELLHIRYAAAALDPAAQENIVQVELHPDIPFDLGALSRHFYTSSSCGLCGKASIDLVRTTSSFLLPPARPHLPLQALYQAPARLQQAQSVFASTGGTHAAALFDREGRLLFLCEDVGRHNAMDKLIGMALSKKMVPLRDHFVLVSGRASFELVQKALMAGIPCLAAIGAASSLAVELAEEYGMTLIGFLREDQGNCYCGEERLLGLQGG